MTSDDPAERFRGNIQAAFAVTGRGTFVTVALDFTGRVRVGDRVSVPLRDGSRASLPVTGVEYADAIGARTTSLALGFGAALEPSSVVCGEWITGA